MKEIYREKYFPSKGQAISYFNKLKQNKNIGFCTYEMKFGKGWTCAWTIIKK